MHSIHFQSLFIWFLLCLFYYSVWFIPNIPNTIPRTELKSCKIRLRRALLNEGGHRFYNCNEIKTKTSNKNSSNVSKTISNIRFNIRNPCELNQHQQMQNFASWAFAFFWFVCSLFCFVGKTIAKRTVKLIHQYIHENFYQIQNQIQPCLAANNLMNVELYYTNHSINNNKFKFAQQFWIVLKQSEVIVVTTTPIHPFYNLTNLTII